MDRRRGLADRLIPGQRGRGRAVGKLGADMQCHNRFIGWPDDDSDDDSSWKAMFFYFCPPLDGRGGEGEEEKKRRRIAR